MIDKVHTTARINGPAYEGIMWAGFSISFCFVGFRLWVRQKTLKKFFSDDYLVILALAVYLLSASLQQTQLENIYELFAMLAGTLVPDLKILNHQTQLLHHVLAFNILFYSGLWSIKLSLLLFFRRLEGGVTKHRYWWWAVLSTTIATLVVCFGNNQFECLIYDVAANFAQYQLCGTAAKVNYQQQVFQMNCAFDIGTDLLIMTVPVALLWNRRISIKKKLVLIGLFSMTVLIIAIAIIRVVVVSSKNVPSDMTWLYVWSNVEMTVALIVSSLASFRQLYMSSQPKHKEQRYPVRNETLPSFVNRFMSKPKSAQDVRTIGLDNGSRSEDSTELFNIPVAP